MSRYVRSDRDLPDHDLILELPGEGEGRLTYHVRHYLHRERHVVIVGEMDKGASPFLAAVAIAGEVTEMLMPDGEFTFVAYAPQSRLSQEPRFREVTFEVDGSSKRPSAAIFQEPGVMPIQSRPLTPEEVEAMTGRPVLTFPYGFYTRRLAEAMNGQPARRLLELLIEADLACPAHGPSPYGEYCADGLGCELQRNERTRKWRPPYSPLRFAADGSYEGVRTASGTQVERVLSRERAPISPIGFSSLGFEWGYGGAGPEETATSLLADYLGFLPHPLLTVQFKGEVVARFPREGFTLPIAELDRWFADVNRARRPGLVVVAGDASGSWATGSSQAMAACIGYALHEEGFDVYEPGRNGEAPRHARGDNRVQAMLHASLLAALERASMIVIPHSGTASTQAVESVTAVRYALEHTDVRTVVAYDRVSPGELERYEAHGFTLELLGRGLPRDAYAVRTAVDRASAAYECLHAA